MSVLLQEYQKVTQQTVGMVSECIFMQERMKQLIEAKKTAMKSEKSEKAELAKDSITGGLKGTDLCEYIYCAVRIAALKD